MKGTIMTDNKDRDTHFQGFAKLLQQELIDLYEQSRRDLQSGAILDLPEWQERNQTLIAQRAFDLAFQVWQESAPETPWDDIPDLTQWPKKASPAFSAGDKLYIDEWPKPKEQD
jgi:hypothetical protein